MIIDQDRLLLETDPLQLGVFFLQKCMFIDEGKNINNGGRCMNLQYDGVGVAMGTPYENELWETGFQSDYGDFKFEVSEIQKWGHIISAVPHFFIDYFELKFARPDGTFGAMDIQKQTAPMSMWIARSIYQLFKIIREWSFMVDEPFNSDHPMAEYSKLVYDVLQPPQNILDEIDAMPDMHLAKFLKGNSDYKSIPPHPPVSQDFKNWILELCQTYRELSFEERLDIMLDL